MIDEKKLIETLNKWKRNAVEKQYAGLKPVPLIEKVINEIRRMAEEENAIND